jgi:DnaJ like chaperone protein
LWPRDAARSNAQVIVTGKIIGALLGLLFTRSPLGLIIGIIIGHLYDQAGERDTHARPSADLADLFFRRTFEIMGYAAKADGRVSEAEIDAARRVMQEFRLGPEHVAEAIDCFRRGKAPQYDADAALAELLQRFGRGHDLLYVFAEIQVRAALVGNGLNAAAAAALGRVAQALGISAGEFARLAAVLRFQFAAGPAPGATAEPAANNLQEVYRELEIESSASDSEVRKAYRRQMSRHHPDKLVANGLPESMAEFAKEKTQRIQKAYELISAARGMR